MRLNRNAYEKLIAEDIEWLKSQIRMDKKFDDGEPHSLEARHIIDVLKWSVVALYEPSELFSPSSAPAKAGVRVCPDCGAGAEGLESTHLRGCKFAPLADGGKEGK